MKDCELPGFSLFSFFFFFFAKRENTVVRSGSI